MTEEAFKAHEHVLKGHMKINVFGGFFFQRFHHYKGSVECCRKMFLFAFSVTRQDA